MPLVHHRAELAPGMLKMGLFFRCFVTLCHIAKFCLHVLSHRHVLSPLTEKMFTLFQQHCNIRLLSMCVSVYVNALARCSACTFCHTGMFCRRVPNFFSLFSSNIVIHLSTSLDVCIGVRECTRALCCVVLLSPLQIRMKMNLFCILGRLQGHRCQLCQIWLRRYWIILCFEHMLWMPCRYNTFDGRLLWFDGVEGNVDWP